MKIRMSSADLKRLRGAMSNPRIESLAFFGHVPVDTSDGKVLLVKELHLLSDKDYASRSAGFVKPKKKFQDETLKKILKAGQHPGLIHTHTFKSEGGVTLSGQDTGNFCWMVDKLRTKVWVDLVFDFDFATFDGEFLELERQLILPIETIEVLGSRIRFFDAPVTVFSEEYFGVRQYQPENNFVSEEHHRQTLIDGFDQLKLQRIKVGILGAGGNGAQLIQMFTCMGVRNLLLADFDKIEWSNLSRIPYALPSDVGKYKVDVAVSYIIRKNRHAGVRVFSEGIESEDVQEAFRACHIIIGCVDDAAARKQLNELSVSCIIPYIDIGCEIIAEHGTARPFGQCRTVIPKETPCLVCTNSIDLERVQLARMSDEEKTRRRASGYIRGTDESPAAAILQLNTGVASLAAQSLIDLVMGFKVKPYIYYDLLDMRMLTPDIQMSERCPVCGTDGLFADGEICFPVDEPGQLDVPEGASHG